MLPEKERDSFWDTIERQLILFCLFFPADRRSVQFADQVRVQKIVKEEIEIDESKMDKLLHYLHEADPSDTSRDPPEMLDLAGKSPKKIAVQFVIPKKIDGLYIQRWYLPTYLPAQKY